MRPRILHVIDHTGNGGAQVVVGYLMAALEEEFDFSVATLGEAGRFSHEYRAMGVSVYELSNGRSRWNPLSLTTLAEIVRQGKYQLIHTHLFKSNVLGTIAAMWAGCKAIIHDHADTYPQALKERGYFPNGLSSFLYLSGYRYALDHCQRVIVLTSGTARAYARVYHIQPERITILSNAVNVEQFNLAIDPAPTCPLHKQLGLPSETRLVTMVGRLESEKDWYTFLKVAHRVQEMSGVPCAFLAIGSGSQETGLRDQVRQLGLDRVFLLGYREDIPQLLGQTDVFLLTSRVEPFGIVVLEAMAAGCPVVTTRSGGPSSIVTHGVNGLLANVGDVDSLSSHVLSLLGDDEQSQKLVRNAREMIASRYTVEAISAQMSTVYREVLEP